MVAKAEALGRIHVIGETPAPSLANWTLEKNNMYGERDEGSATGNI